MAKFLIQTTSVQIAYFLYFLVRVRDRSFFIMQGAAGGIWGVGGMRKKNWLSGGGIRKIGGVVTGNILVKLWNDIMY